MKSWLNGMVMTVAVSPSPAVADIAAVSSTRFTLPCCTGAGAAETRRDRRERGRIVESGEIMFNSFFLFLV